MQEALDLQFGSLTCDEYATLVWSRFADRGAMEEDPGAGMDVDSDLDFSDDDFDPTLPSPDALARELEMLETPATEVPVVDAIPIVEPAPTPVVAPSVTPVVAPSGNQMAAPSAMPVPGVNEPVRPTELTPSFSEKEEQKGVTDYLRSCQRDRAVLFDGVHDSDKKSVQEAWRHTQNAVRAACALSQRHSNLAKVMFLQAHLAERPLNIFIEEVGKWAEARELELLKPNPDPKYVLTLPPYELVCAVLEREFLAGQRQSMYDITEMIFNTKLYMLAEKYGVKTFPTLAQIWQDYKAMFRERASLIPGEGEFDKYSLIFLYLNAIPSNMYSMLRHVKDANGQVKEPNDPVMLENSILALGDQFLIDLRKRRESKLGKMPMHSNSRPSGSGAGPFGSGAGGHHNSSDKKRPYKAPCDKGKGKQQQQQGGGRNLLDPLTLSGTTLTPRLSPSG